MILAIDCGSTNHKVALFDERLARLATASRSVAYTVRDGERAEFDPEKIWRDTLTLIRQVCAAASVWPRRIRTVALASQAQTFTLLDAAGKPVMPFFSWADKRATEEAAELKRAVGQDFHHHCSFSSPLPQLQVSKLKWISRHQPEWLRGKPAITSLPAFLAFRLAGLHCTDNNLAAMSGLYSLAGRDWWPAALAAGGVDHEQCGHLAEAGVAVSAANPCIELDLSPELRVVFAGNDQTAGAFANVSRANQLVVTLGTALVAYRFAGEAMGPFQPAGCWGPYPGGGFYELTTRDEGGAALDWAASQLRPGDSTAFAKLAADGSRGASFFYPQFIRTSQAWLGSNDPAARARAVFDGIGFSLRELVGAMPQSGLDGEPIVAIGGGSENPWWLRILANILNRPVRRGDGDILLGAAMMARPGVNPPRSELPPVMSPEPDAAAEYERLFRAWQEQAPQQKP